MCLITITKVQHFQKKSSNNKEKNVKALEKAELLAENSTKPPPKNTPPGPLADVPAGILVL